MHDKTQNQTPPISFQGQILLAMPHLSDPRFHQAVILLCAHDAKGAMGFVLNHEMSNVPLESLLAELAIDPDGSLTEGMAEPFPLLAGGPLEMGRGYMLHTPDYERPETIVISDQFSLTATIESIKDTLGGQGPTQKLLVLGYAGWDAGQLEQEIKDGSWLLCPATTELVFQIPNDAKWQAGFMALGVDPRALSATVGNA